MRRGIQGRSDLPYSFDNVPTSTLGGSERWGVGLLPEELQRADRRHRVVQHIHCAASAQVARRAGDVDQGGCRYVAPLCNVRGLVSDRFESVVSASTCNVEEVAATTAMATRTAVTVVFIRVPSRVRKMRPVPILSPGNAVVVAPLISSAKSPAVNLIATKPVLPTTTSRAARSAPRSNTRVIGSLAATRACALDQMERQRGSRYNRRDVVEPDDMPYGDRQVVETHITESGLSRKQRHA